MLAHTLRARDELLAGEWTAEEKFDGHRLLVKHDPELAETVAWSRDGRVRTLAPHVRSAFSQIQSACILDGELCVPNGHSYNVTELTRQAELVFVAFDLLAYGDVDLVETHEIQEHRTSRLFELISSSSTGPIRVSASRSLLHDPFEELEDFAREVWARNGEGLILKRQSGLYKPGKRSRDWLKLKKSGSAIVTLTGFQLGLKGPFSVATFIDTDGNSGAVKWKDHAWLASANDSWIGRRFRIEFHERTPSGSYRHPHWDRFVETDEVE
jgi:bifunctional non-homologous end joining protein LigD